MVSGAIWSSATSLLDSWRTLSIEDAIFGLSYLQKHVRQFQELFPYRYFGSPGMVVKERVCSIFGALFKLRSGCEHVVGEIYNGELCSRILLGLDVLEVSIVDSPVHKYSVIFGPDITSTMVPSATSSLGLALPGTAGPTRFAGSLMARRDFLERDGISVAHVVPARSTRSAVNCEPESTNTTRCFLKSHLLQRCQLT